LRDLLPNEAAELDRRAAQLAATLNALDRELAALLAPCAGRPFLVHHPAWEALANRYGLEQVAVEVDGKDPLDHELAALRDQVARLGLTTLFVQPQVRRGPALAVAGTLSLATVELDPLAADPPTALRHAADAIAATCIPAANGPRS
jgi:zinc transport system substrate-binding protein